MVSCKRALTNVFITNVRLKLFPCLNCLQKDLRIHYFSERHEFLKTYKIEDRKKFTSDSNDKKPTEDKYLVKKYTM